jgi:lipopolysaccharide/colanic/teichoic acid biosynthesis glycosyltransferase
LLRRIESDLEYIDNWSLWLDVVILARTVVPVLVRYNAY